MIEYKGCMFTYNATFFLHLSIIVSNKLEFPLLLK